MKHSLRNRICQYIDGICLIWWIGLILFFTLSLSITGLLASSAVVIIILMLFYNKSIPFVFKRIALFIFLEIFIACGVLIFLTISIEPECLWNTILVKGAFFINTAIITYYLLRLSMLNRTLLNSDISSNKKHNYIKTSILIWWGLQIILLIIFLKAIGFFISIAILILLILYHSKKIPFFTKELILYGYIIILTITNIMAFFAAAMNPINYWFGYVLAYSPFIDLLVLYYYLFTLKYYTN